MRNSPEGGPKVTPQETQVRTNGKVVGPVKFETAPTQADMDNHIGNIRYVSLDGKPGGVIIQTLADLQAKLKQTPPIALFEVDTESTPGLDGSGHEVKQRGRG